MTEIHLDNVVTVRELQRLLANMLEETPVLCRNSEGVVVAAKIVLQKVGFRDSDSSYDHAIQKSMMTSIVVEES